MSAGKEIRAPIDPRLDPYDPPIFAYAPSSGQCKVCDCVPKNLWPYVQKRK